MLAFPLLMWYMWIGATFYDGQLPLPVDGQSLSAFAKHLGLIVYDNAFPTAKAWAMYWTFFIVQGLFYLYMPGVWGEGKPLPHLGGKKLPYYCSGVWSFYTTIVLAAALHFTGIFKLNTILDEFGPLLSVAILSGFLVSIVAYFSALARGAQHRMTGNFIYDFFMGAELNPRLFGKLDFKMFFEVRLPWFILFLLSAAAAARQYEKYGYVSGEVGFVLMAHFLYANACAKGEELITTTWDMYYEKWGFMLIFWNLAGVPLSYCHCTLYLANHHPTEYAWPKWALISLYVSYLFVYWVWDTCNSQKNMFRQRERGQGIDRKTFPQLPWKEVKNPKKIPTKTGDSLLASGWYGLARKVHYSCDVFFALSWGAITGFHSPFPWFYPVFFLIMISHRANRDIARCKERYGAAWEEYTRQVPYLFIPVRELLQS
ncbi:sterol reductase/lamin B receptor [Microthyrium microscopicum]|uniref:Delta(24(24(1)))-sterol reductase n=1 Tax=Microthyrium microscopicum TaxID=703497 RepID=A0A6A6UP51_9PEZI|nr:sterol reductase/lamin B receptor [Microthyrium microscopicum]